MKKGGFKLPHFKKMQVFHYFLNFSMVDGQIILTKYDLESWWNSQPEYAYNLNIEFVNKISHLKVSKVTKSCDFSGCQSIASRVFHDNAAKNFKNAKETTYYKVQDLHIF